MQRLGPTRILLVLAAMAVLAFVAFVSAPRTASSSSMLLPVSTLRPTTTPEVSLLDWLPRNPVRDGSVDYTVHLQSALDSAAGRTLILPDFPVLVSKRPGEAYCLVVRGPIHVRGTVSSQLVENLGGCQILRVQNADGVRLTGFSLKGSGEQGTDLSHGLLQVFSGSDIAVEDVTVFDSDADGIVVADARRVSVRNCRAVRSSRAGLYLLRCVGGIVADNQIEDGVGHRAADGSVVGAGIQLSSNTDITCTGNIVRNGIGIGILLDAHATSAAPTGCTIVGNRVRGWRNTLNPDHSAGIRLQNSAKMHATHSLVSANTVESCGSYGIYVENQDGVSILGNTIVASDRSSICISTSQGAQVLSNVISETDTGLSGNQAGLQLINGASGVIAQGNRIDSRSTAPYVASVQDQSSGSGNSVDAQQRRANAPPTTGLWSRGDVVWNAEPWPGAPLAWICTSGGTPGVWSVSGRIE